jgi:2-amino-4-hydroxy-6-hydroxymethyldihydropteridine diphosphokinase
MHHILVAAGSNLPNGDISPLETVRHAQISLEQRGWRPLRVSSYYQNPAWPPGAGAPDYVNAVLRVAGEGGPERLLADLHAIEAAAGRTRGARDQSRTLDLDLLAWGELVLPDAATAGRWVDAKGDDRRAMPDRLILPHPRMHERAFVLVPLAEVAPDWRHPILGKTAADLRDALPGAALAGLRAL